MFIHFTIINRNIRYTYLIYIRVYCGFSFACVRSLSMSSHYHQPPSSSQSGEGRGGVADFSYSIFWFLVYMATVNRCKPSTLCIEINSAARTHLIFVFQVNKDKILQFRIPSFPHIRHKTIHTGLGSGKQIKKHIIRVKNKRLCEACLLIIPYTMYIIMVEL